MRAKYGNSHGGLHVLVAGGGVAALETLIGLKKLAGDLVDVELVAPEPEFWYRPLAAAEPFGAGRSERFDLAALSARAGGFFTLGRLASVDPVARVARTANGALISYDVFVAACGALPRPWLKGALLFRGPADSEKLRALLAEAQRGEVRSIAFAAPRASVLPLPLYELALQTASHLEARNRHVELTVVTPEPEPLWLFGGQATAAVSKLLADAGVGLRTGCYPVHTSTLGADRVVALPRLEGLRILGLPQDEDGFIGTDLHGRVTGPADVYAAGDITRFPIKQGGIATQQADAVAESIAAAAGADVDPRPFRPVLRGLLLTGKAPRYLKNELAGGHGDASVVSTDAPWWPPAKIVGRYLSPFLAEVTAAGEAVRR
jgi:sulfide:quinone oxidoreductase